jgi:hypothetical protein
MPSSTSSNSSSSSAGARDTQAHILTQKVADRSTQTEERDIDRYRNLLTQRQHRKYSPTHIDRQRQAQKHISIWMNTKKNTHRYRQTDTKENTQKYYREPKEKDTQETEHKHTWGQTQRQRQRHKDQLAHMLGI